MHLYLWSNCVGHVTVSLCIAFTILQNKNEGDSDGDGDGDDSDGERCVAYSYNTCVASGVVSLPVHTCRCVILRCTLRSLIDRRYVVIIIIIIIIID